VRVHPGFDRRRAFARLGDFIQELGGRYVAGADFGTGAGDLAILAEHTEHVHVNEAELTAALAVAHHACVSAVIRVSEDLGEGEVTVAIQGVGSVGGAIARHLGQEGFHLLLADLNPRHLESLETHPHATVLPSESILSAPADILAPCALGGVLTAATVAGIQAKAVVPGANNVFFDENAERSLDARGVLCVPDVLSSAGAVVLGIGSSLMGWERITPHLQRLGSVAEEVLLEARVSGRMPGLIARERALQRLEGPLW
jgi:leucine dehydrogenase